MRVGQNPARFVEKVAHPAEITVTVVNCIPFLSGYYEQSLDALKIVVDSLDATREEAHPYDVMIFDNHSCGEVRAYLKDASEQGKIQYLLLSDTNIGKIGAWNTMFGAAQGKYTVFADGDVGFRQGWLNASLELFEAFPNVGMVTARPLRTSMDYSPSTLAWASQHPGILEEGQFIDWNVYWEHASSVGMSEEEGRINFPSKKDYRLTYNGKTALIGATHFQFMARSQLLKQIVPLPSEQPMRGERELDIRIDKLGCLRLLTEKPYVWHMGNRPGLLNSPSVVVVNKKTLLKRLLYLPIVRNVLLWLNNQIFRLYFFNVE
jgi:hypothetical protein